MSLVSTTCVLARPIQHHGQLLASGCQKKCLLTYGSFQCIQGTQAVSTRKSGRQADKDIPHPPTDKDPAPKDAAPKDPAVESGTHVIWELFKALQNDVFMVKQNLKTAQLQAQPSATQDPNTIKDLQADVKKLQDDLKGAQDELALFKSTIKDTIATEVDQRLTVADVIDRIRTVMFPPGAAGTVKMARQQGRHRAKNKEVQVSKALPLANYPLTVSAGRTWCTITFLSCCKSVVRVRCTGLCYLPGKISPA
jgi:hypothetical protein